MYFSSALSKTFDQVGHRGLFNGNICNDYMNKTAEKQEGRSRQTQVKLARADIVFILSLDAN